MKMKKKKGLKRTKEPKFKTKKNAFVYCIQKDINHRQVKSRHLYEHT